MLNTLINDLNFSQKIQIKKKFSNKELLLYNYFITKTKIIPDNVILVDDFIFYFIKIIDYYRCKAFHPVLRKEFSDKKVLLICVQNTLIKQIFSFFPDTYIYDLKLEKNKHDDDLIITICFLSYEERGIAVGKGGDYITAINKILKNYVIYKGKYLYKFPLKLQCELINF